MAVLDAGVVCHEYAHGISARLVGGAQTVGCENNGEQRAEGISDYFGLMMTTDWANCSSYRWSKIPPDR